MTFMVTFKVNANPVGKQRARYVKRGNFVQTYTPDKTRNYESLIKEAAIEAICWGDTSINSTSEGGTTG